MRGVTLGSHVLDNKEKDLLQHFSLLPQDEEQKGKEWTWGHVGH